MNHFLLIKITGNSNKPRPDGFFMTRFINNATIKTSLYGFFIMIFATLCRKTNERSHKGSAMVFTGTFIKLLHS